MAYSENTLIVDIVKNGSGDDVWYSLSVPGAEILSALKNGGVKLRQVVHTDRDKTANPAVPQTDLYNYYKLSSVLDEEDGQYVQMLFDNGDVYMYDPSVSEYPYLNGEAPGEPVGSGGGSGGGVLVVGVTMSGKTFVLDKTWQEIFDAAYPIIVAAQSLEDNAEGHSLSKLTVYEVYQYTDGDGKYYVNASSDLGQTFSFISDTASGYPTAS